jgi:hypothetical protein
VGSGDKFEKTGGTEMRRGNYKVNSAEVLAITKDTFRHGARGYFRIDEAGNTEIYPIRTRLMELGMGSSSASKILEAANIPSGSFIINKTRDKTFTTVKADVEVYSVHGETTCQEADRPLANASAVEIADAADEGDLDELEEDESEPEFPTLEIPASHSSKPGKKPMTVEEREETLARQEEAANSKRFQYIETSSGKFGVWDDINGYVVFLAYTQEEVIEELARLKAGKSYAVTYTGGSGTTRPRITY